MQASSMYCKWNPTKLHCIHYIKSTPLCLSFLSENVRFVFHIITEENGQLVGTYPAFAGQNLKFTRQMTNDNCLFPGMHNKLCGLVFLFSSLLLEVFLVELQSSPLYGFQFFSRLVTQRPRKDLSGESSVTSRETAEKETRVGEIFKEKYVHTHVTQDIYNNSKQSLRS